MSSSIPIKTGAWDPEEDELLYYWQSKVGNKWSEVAKHIPGRTGQQCAQRWRHKVNPAIRRDKWSAEEDAQLIDLVKTFGIGRWAEIARHCDGRTDQQCMGRWRRHLDPSIRRDSWSAEEDAKLRALHAQYGTSWSRISRCLKGRTSQQCRARWHQINNTRSRGAACGALTGSSAPTPAPRSGSARRSGSCSGRRRPSRRRASDFTSESDEDDGADDLDDADDGLCGECSDDGEQQQQQHHLPPSGSPGVTPASAAAAAVAFELAAGCGAMPELSDVPHAAAGWIKTTLPSSISVHAGLRAHGLVRSSSDLAAAADQERGRQVVAAATAAASCASGAASVVGVGFHSAAPVSRVRSMPVSVGRRASSVLSRHASSTSHWAGASGAAEHVERQGGQQQEPEGPQPFEEWSPSRLLLSPPQHPRAQQRRAAMAPQMMRPDGSNAATNDADDAAGAETLLAMASLLRRDSGGLDPPQSVIERRCSDLAVMSTPPKRAAEGYPGERHGACCGEEVDHQHASCDDLPDGLTPSPFKRARGARGALFSPARSSDGGGGGAAAAAADGACGVQQPPSRLAAAPASARSSRGTGTALTTLRRGGGCRGASDEDESPPPCFSVLSCRRPSGAKEDRRPAAQHGPPHDGLLEEEGLGECVPGTALDLDHDLGCSAGGLGAALPPPPARPSNASSLTGVRGGGITASALLSPPPMRQHSGVHVTPRRSVHAAADATTAAAAAAAAQQQHLVNFLGSPSFERMGGGSYASPPSAGRTQPSAATLAALQSPQPSRIHEPHWTPFTGLFKEPCFSRGPSATPDLPSSGKERGRSSGGGCGSSSSKSLPRRTLLGSESPPGTASHALGEDALPSCAAAPSAGGSGGAAPGDGDVGPSPAAARGVAAAPAVQHHRVVRRLDQHEAWGASSPGAGGAGGSSSGGGGGGCTAEPGTAGPPPRLFSPVRKQRVPLFHEVSGTGSSPARPDAATDVFPCPPPVVPAVAPTASSDGVASAASEAAVSPLRERMPVSRQLTGAFPTGSSPLCASRGGPGAVSSSRATAAAAGGGAALPSLGRMAAARLLSPPGSSRLGRAPLSAAAAQASSAAQLQLHLQREQQQQQAPHALPHQQPQQSSQQQQEISGYEASPMAISPDAADAAAGDAASDQAPQPSASQQQQQQRYPPTSSVSGGSALAAAPAGCSPVSVGDPPDTPVQAHVSCDNTSCSGTPNTPGGERALGLLLRRGAAASPSDYVTPQQRVRPSRPLAPLHKDCLIAAATRSLAGAAAGGGLDANATPATTDASVGGALGGGGGTAAAAAAAAAAGMMQHHLHRGTGAGSSAEAVALPSAGAAATGEAIGGGGISGASARCGSAPGSADSSKLLSPAGGEGGMDSPLQPCQQLQSPSHWHAGMVAMLRHLQQTPLQPHSSTCGDVRCGSDGDSAGMPFRASAALLDSSTGAVTGPGGSGAAAAALQPPCSDGVVVRPQAGLLSKAPHAGAVRPGSRALRRLQAELERGGSGGSGSGAASFYGHADAADVQVLPFAATLLPQAAGGAVVAPQQQHHHHHHRRLAPGGADALLPLLHTTPATLPTDSALAWPVSQRADGGLVVSAPAAAAVTAADGAAALQLTPQLPVTNMGGGSSSSGGGSGAQWWPSQGGGRLSLVSLQPVTVMAAGLLSGGGGGGAVLSQQPAAAAAAAASTPATAAAGTGTTAAVVKALTTATAVAVAGGGGVAAAATAAAAAAVVP